MKKGQRTSKTALPREIRKALKEGKFAIRRYIPPPEPKKKEDRGDRGR